MRKEGNGVFVVRLRVFDDDAALFLVRFPFRMLFARRAVDHLPEAQCVRRKVGLDLLGKVPFGGEYLQRFSRCRLSLAQQKEVLQFFGMRLRPSDVAARDEVRFIYLARDLARVGGKFRAVAVSYGVRAPKLCYFFRPLHETLVRGDGHPSFHTSSSLIFLISSKGTLGVRSSFKSPFTSCCTSQSCV